MIGSATVKHDSFISASVQREKQMEWGFQYSLKNRWKNNYFKKKLINLLMKSS